MKTTSIATMALRLAAIYFWVYSVLESAFLFRFFTLADEGFERAALIGHVTFLTGSILLGAVFWVVSRPWAHRILGSNDPATRGQELGTLAFRLIGIWLVDRALQSGGFLLGFLDHPPGNRFAYGPALASFVLQLALGVILILGGPILARRGFPSDEDSSSPGSGYPRLAFSVLAIAILADAIPELVGAVLRSGFWTSDVYNSSDYLRYLVVAAFRVFLGLALFIGVGPLARFWKWVQTAGLDRKPLSNA